jgi:hypothetical protein
MRWVFVAGVAGLALAGCDQPAEVAKPCLDPVLTPKAAAGTWPGEHERAQICIEVSAFQIARKGGPVEAAGEAATAKCAGNVAASFKALRKSGPVWPYQRKQIEEDYAHFGLTSAARARSEGCGAAPGQPEEAKEGECAWWWCSKK